MTLASKRNEPKSWSRGQLVEIEKTQHICQTEDRNLRARTCKGCHLTDCSDEDWRDSPRISCCSRSNGSEIRRWLQITNKLTVTHQLVKHEIIYLDIGSIVRILEAQILVWLVPSSAIWNAAKNVETWTCPTSKDEEPYLPVLRGLPASISP